MELGKVIKKVRLEKKLTQEDLANAIGVSVQAVSRWETNVSYPDITLIPAIANYLNISADELFDIKLEERKIKIKKILDLDDEYTKVFELEKSLNLINESLKEYPNDEHLLLRLSRNYHNQILLLKDRDGYEEKSLELRKKIIEVTTKILEIAKSDWIRDTARGVLCTSYPYLGEEGKVKAKEMALETTSIFNSKEMLLEGILEGEEQRKQVVSNILNCLQIIRRSMSYRICDFLDDTNEKINIFKKIIEISKIIIGDNLYYYHLPLSNWTFKIAELYAELKDEENTLQYLKESSKHAREYTLLPSVGEYDSYWLKGAKWEKNAQTGWKGNIRSFENKVFDFVREKEGFKGALYKYIEIDEMWRKANK